MDIDEVSRIAASLDGVRESSVKGRLKWSLGGRLVARQLDDWSIVIRTDSAEREQLLVAHPATFFVPPRFDTHAAHQPLHRATRHPVALAAQLSQIVRAP